MTPSAFLVHYGNSLSVLCRDEGSADKHVRDLHGYDVQALYALTAEQVRYLAAMPKEQPCALFSCSAPP
jgi:hypothetical protein